MPRKKKEEVVEVVETVVETPSPAGKSADVVNHLDKDLNDPRSL